MLKFLARQVLSRSEVGKLDEMEEMEQVARILERTEVADVDKSRRCDGPPRLVPNSRQRIRQLLPYPSWAMGDGGRI